MTSIRLTRSFGSPAEDVLVCTETKTFQEKRITIYTIINKDSDGEEVSASRWH